MEYLSEVLLLELTLLIVYESIGESRYMRVDGHRNVDKLSNVSNDG